MQKLLAKLDDLAEIKSENSPAKWLERIAFIFLFLMVLSAPHSIAATQTAWLCGMLAWVIRLFIKPRPRLVRTPLDIALWTFFGWTVLISFFSYEPLVSINKLRGAALFLIFYFVINNLRNLRALKFLVFALIFSCMVNVLWTPIERIIGRGVEIHGVSVSSPFNKVILYDGDTLLKANGKKIKTPEDLVAEIEQTGAAKVYFYRPDFYYTVEIKREDLLSGNALQKLGIENWKKSRNWRSQGFYGHYVTYAEVLQLIISLVFGLFIAGLLSSKFKVQISKFKVGKFLPFFFSPFLLFCLAAMAFALLLTVTRSSQLALLVSAFSIVLLNGNRKILLALAVIILPVALGGLYVLQQSRQVGFFDQKDDSTKYRQTVYREGLNLWLQSPRHFFVGIGMDTTTKKEYIEKWHLFDDGKLPLSHFHSTPIQLLVERGLFGLLFWLFVFGVYLRTLWRGLKKLSQVPRPTSQDSDEEIFSSQLKRGVILGCFGGAIGFFTSGIVQYNLGDGEVAMMFYLLTGFGVFAADFKTEREL
jgi:hypothetical protein